MNTNLGTHRNRHTQAHATELRRTSGDLDKDNHKTIHNTVHSTHTIMCICTMVYACDCVHMYVYLKVGPSRLNVNIKLCSILIN